MIRHIVEFRLTADNPIQQKEQTVGIRERLSALVGVVPGLRSVSVGRDLGVVPGHWDVVLVSEHDSSDDLAAYQAHPAHVAAAEWISRVVTERAVVDYEY